MPEHAENVAALLHRPAEIQRQPELGRRWAREDMAKRVPDQFEKFKTTPEGQKWQARELNRIRDEESSFHALDAQVLRLKQKESLPESGDPTAYIGLGRVPDFIKNENSANGEANWNALRVDSFAEVARNSRDLQGAWDNVAYKAIQELKAEGKLNFAEISILKEAMDTFWSELGQWDKARHETALPKLNTFASHSAQEFVKRHKAVFDKIDGAASPTAKYKLLATFQAIMEMQSRQRDNLLQPSYARMLARLNEIPGRQDTTLINIFNKDAQHIQNPHEVWKELLKKANMDLRRLAVKESPDFVTRFGKMTGLVQPGDFRPAINFQSNSERLTQILAKWPATKAPWPASNEVWENAHRIAWLVENLKMSVDGAFSGGNEAREIRESYHALLDAVAKRVSLQLEQLQ
jgi:hypothetical protein